MYSDDECNCEEDVLVDKFYDWNRRRELYSDECVDKMVVFIKNEKAKDLDSGVSSCPVVLPEQLNEQQLFAFNIVDYFNKKDEQLLMIMPGCAGTGKTFTTHAISHLLGNSVNRTAATGKAACLINGETIHSMFSLPIC